MRVAIIGQGPRGIQALGELLSRWPGGEPLEVHSYDPSPPGAGAAYRVDQPDFLRLNVHPRIVHQPPAPPLVDWLRERGISPDGDVPRRLVGLYLAEALDEMVRRAAPGIAVRPHVSRVDYLSHQAGQGWLVGAEVPQVVDEVLLATGHAPDHDLALAHRWADPRVRLVPGVYPVETMLSLEAVPPGSVVALRGASLTFIDVALALTEGRAPAERPSVIRPLARTGMLMASKPATALHLLPDEQELVKAFSETLPADPDGALDAVRLVATQMLVLAGEPAGSAAERVAVTLARGCEPELDGPGRAVRQLHVSIAVAECAAPAGPAAMLGRAWQALYPAVVRRLAHGRPDPEAWQRFLATAAVLEKFAFGPTLSQAIRLAGLCQRGEVDLSWLEAGVRVTDRIEGLPDGDGPPDVLVDAVLSPPGAATARNQLVDRLVADGLARTAPGLRGLDVTPRAQCLDASGRPTPGLSAVGRLVEDVVIGHDTLSHGLHDEIEQWATRLVDATRPEEAR
ncbi:FAD/NAD(P)-binding protein [Luteococcus peritonei]|uniref:FAD/NAD(P)-binding protein n=1 Tax=Luteococcus peritonei TaxID=88874 RepID=A0ABW4RU37_9ACTN